MKPLLQLCIFLFSLTLPVFSDYSKEVLVETILKTDKTSLGQKIDYPQSDRDEVTVARVTLPPGKSTGWHKHSFPVFAYILQGTLSIEFKTGEIRQFQEKSSFAEVIDVLHNGKNNGQENVVLLAFFMGEKEKPLSIKE